MAVASAPAAVTPQTATPAVAAVPEPSTRIAAAPAAACANCAAAEAVSPQSISDAFQRILTSTANWLSGLPANPITEFLQGALWLVRRTIFPASVGVVTAPITVPLYFTDADGDEKLGIYVALGNSDTPQLFEFDTGGSGFYAAYASANPGFSPWWGSNAPVGTTPVQVRFDSGLNYSGNAVPTTVSLFSSPGSGVPLVSTGTVTVGQMDSIKNDKTDITYWTPQGSTTPPISGAFYGDFGASLKYASNGISGLLAQLTFAQGITPGYRVHVDPKANQAWVQIGLTPADVGSATGLYFPMVPDPSAPTGASIPYSGARYYSEQLFTADITIAKFNPATKEFETVVLDRGVGITPDTGAQTALHNTDATKTPLPTQYAGITERGKPKLEKGLQFSLSGTTVDGSTRDYFQFTTTDTTNDGRVSVQNGSDSSSPLHYLNTGLALFYANDVVYSMGTSSTPGTVGLIPTGTVIGGSSRAAVGPTSQPDGPTATAAATSAASGGWQPGSIFRFFFSDGTAEHPDAGLLIGNGFSYDSTSCPATTPCSGGRGGLLIGNGGNGFNGGDGGNSSSFWGTAGNGGNGSPAAGAPGGDGGNAGLFGTGGTGGIGGAGAAGGNGGQGGLLSGDGGAGGAGGAGIATVAAGTGGTGGRGGNASPLSLGGNGGKGGQGGTGTTGTAGTDGTRPGQAGRPGLTGATGGTGGAGGDSSWLWGSGGQGGTGGNGGTGGSGGAGAEGAHSPTAGGIGAVGGAGGAGGTGGVGGAGGQAGTGHVAFFRTTGLAGAGGVGGTGGSAGAGGRGGRGGDGSEKTRDGGTGGKGGDGAAGGSGGTGGVAGSGLDGVPGNGGAGGGGGPAGPGGTGGAGVAGTKDNVTGGNGGTGGDPGTAGSGGTGGVQGAGCGCARDGISGPLGVSMTSGGDGGAGGDGFTGGDGGSGGDGGTVGGGGQGGKGGDGDSRVRAGAGGSGGTGGKLIGDGGDGGKGGAGGGAGPGGAGGRGGNAQAELSDGGDGGNGGDGVFPGADGGDGGAGGALGDGGAGGNGGKPGPGGTRGKDGRPGTP